MLFLVAMRAFIMARLAVPDDEAIFFGSFDKTGENLFPLRLSSWFFGPLYSPEFLGGCALVACLGNVKTFLAFDVPVL